MSPQGKILSSSDKAPRIPRPDMEPAIYEALNELHGAQVMFDCASDHEGRREAYTKVQNVLKGLVEHGLTAKEYPILFKPIYVAMGNLSKLPEAREAVAAVLYQCVSQ